MYLVRTIFSCGFGVLASIYSTRKYSKYTVFPLFWGTMSGSKTAQLLYVFLLITAAVWHGGKLYYLFWLHRFLIGSVHCCCPCFFKLFENSNIRMYTIYLSKSHLQFSLKKIKPHCCTEWRSLFIQSINIDCVGLLKCTFFDPGS